MEIAKKVMDIVEDFRPDYGLRNANLTWEDLALDSLDKVEIVMAAEKQCRAAIPDLIANRLETPGDLIVCARALRAKKAPGEIKKLPGLGGGMCVVQDNRPTCVLDMQPCHNIRVCNPVSRYQEVCATCNCAKYNDFVKSR